MSTEPSIDVVWGRIRALAGEEFRTKTGRPLTYSVSGDVLHPSRTKYNLQKSEFAKALRRWPVRAPGEITDLRGSSYIWAILNDSRVLGQAPGTVSESMLTQAGGEDAQGSATIATTKPCRAEMDVVPRSGPLEDESSSRIGLVGCVKTKLPHAAPAASLYTSALFCGRRAYVERTCERWFVLSAEYGLVAPEEVIDTYDKTLKAMSTDAKRRWSRHVMDQLAERLGSLAGLTFEIHAGKDYFGYGLRGGLREAGAAVVIPTEHMSQGAQLAFYKNANGTGADCIEIPSASTNKRGAALAAEPSSIAPKCDDEAVLEAIAALDEAPVLVAAREWPDGITCLDRPGLYAWYADAAGAAELSQSLGFEISAGRIYAGQAGATKWPSGKVGVNTLGARIGQMHLGGKVGLSTFRWTLAAILFERLDVQVQAAMVISPSSEQALTDWMHEHLSVAVHPHHDRDTLEGLERELLSELDPPLNLRHMARTPLRVQLTELRRRIGREQ